MVAMTKFGAKMLRNSGVYILPPT